ncbi:MAG: epoxyqueuosine reductase [Clostridiales bacterium]|nr:epoxyqueuosine reductase [Clostridiales bacterium]
MQTASNGSWKRDDFVKEQRVKEIFTTLGADACGIASADAFTDAPHGHHPKDLLPGCKSVIAFLRAMPKGLAMGDLTLYGYFNGLEPDVLDRIALNGAGMLEREFGCTALPLPADGPVASWEEATLKKQGYLSVKHAAVLAGLGSMGKSTLLFHEAYGNWVNIGVVLTDLFLQADPPQDSICIPGCTRCMENCPTGAIQNGTVVQALCRPHTYPGGGVVACNTCRTICPMRFGKTK